MNKKLLEIFKRTRRSFYNTKYKTLFKKTIEFDGIENYEANYIMDKLYTGNSIAAFKLNTNNEINNLIGFGVFSTQGFGMYRQPVYVKILKENNSSFIPNETLQVHKSVSILNTEHNPLALIQPLIDQLIEIDITIRQNIKTHRMPFMVQRSDDKTIYAIENAIEGHTIIEVGTEVINVLNTQTPFYIDDLHRYRVEIEHEILTILGIDNVKYEKGAQMSVDETNSNNDEINVFKASIIQNMEIWLNEIKKLFNVDIKIKKNTYLGADEGFYEEDNDEEIDRTIEVESD